MIHLPPELIDSIVDNIAKEDRATLKSLCLVASVFLVACQRRLHTNLYVSSSSSKRPPTGSGWRSSSDALAHLTSSPHIAAYITHLTILITNVDLDDEEMALAMRDTTVASVFRCLSRLKEARIQGSAIYRGNSTRIRVVHPGIIQTFLDIYTSHRQLERTRKLKGLSFKLMDVEGLSVELVRKALVSADSLSCVRVRLSLDSDSESEHNGSDVDNDNDNSHSPPPTSLTISSSWMVLDLFSHLEFARHFSFLRHLTLQNIATQNHLEICFFAAQTLETLHLSFQYRLLRDTLTFPVDFPRLHRVHLYIGMFFEDGEERVPSSSIALLSRATALTELTLQFTDYLGMPSQLIFDPVSFATLDSMLVVHPTLSLFCYTVSNVAEDPAEYIDTLGGKIRQLMPRAAEKGILRVEHATS
ncbi:hypothetical protein MIND_01115000 [Mycena indigotica]|uniref:F-box domain-containing protein n=1 Tax=Mycena indigotica TaxID=2126181 RepID=A0A8H6S795_9AGAR|nr:uncharacterized protein MIND_01115000 [Mycena indigotica]KAF7293381.1 hypothetical protein MIND_01115000 [Mycena indigotica]